MDIAFNHKFIIKYYSYMYLFVLQLVKNLCWPYSDLHSQADFGSIFSLYVHLNILCITANYFHE